MSPFGFGPADENNPEPDFNEIMRRMQSEFQKLSQNFPNLTGGFGFNPITGLGAAATGENASALPKEVIREVAKRFIQAQGSTPIGANDQAKCEEALNIANTWLDQATLFPAITSDHPAISPLDWLNITIEGWHSTFEPLATGLTEAVTKMVEEATAAMQGQVPAQLGPMGQILRSFIGGMLATQMGQTIGALASSSKGANDAALPIVENFKPSLSPQALRKFGAELQIPETEIAIYFALREAATVRLFESNPWLVAYMKAAIAEYGKGIHIDLDEIQRQAEESMRNIQENLELNPDSENPINLNAEFSLALNNGLFTPEETPQQAAALEKLETSLALIDGWIEEVINLAAADRLPSLAALSELLRRERVSNSPIQQLFKALFNLEVSPRKVREATFFWYEIRKLKGIDARDKIWSGLLPTSKELTDPIAFVSSTEIPDDLSGLL